LFAIPTKEKFVLFLKGYGEVEVSKSILPIVDTSDIDREKYFEKYIKPFAQSITFEYVRRL